MANILVGMVFAVWICFRSFLFMPDHYVHIIFCDVGQGDAIIISRGSSQMLIDGGKDSSVLDCLEKYIPMWDRSLEIVLATHPDADHILGLIPVLDSYEVKYLITNGQSKETDDFGRFYAAAEQELLEGTELIVGNRGQQIKLDNNIDISILHPKSDAEYNKVSINEEAETLLSDVKVTNSSPTQNANDHSIVLLLEYNLIQALFTGDLEKGGEQALLDSGLITDVEVLKVGHHGSKTSSIPDLIVTSRPEISVISAGKNNTYGHPHPQVLRTLEENGSLIVRTDVSSSIELITDGVSIWQSHSRFF